jgi:hypothetical protein
MSVAQILADFKSATAQCESLITNAHRTDASGASLLPTIDQKQITVAAFLNMFIAWETFLEACFLEFMMGGRTLNGSSPVRYVSPVNVEAARRLILGVQWTYFDYAKHEHVLGLARMFFRNGYPFEPHISGNNADLADSRTMRNWCAHKTSTTQAALDTLALRIFGSPRATIDLYALLMAIDPRTRTGTQTVFVTYKDKLSATAEAVARG